MYVAVDNIGNIPKTAAKVAVQISALAQLLFVLWKNQTLDIACVVQA